MKSPNFSPNFVCNIIALSGMLIGLTSTVLLSELSEAQLMSVGMGNWLSAFIQGPQIFGLLTGCLLAAIIGKTYGRRVAGIASGILFILFALSKFLEASSFLGMSGTFLGGTAAGTALLLMPIYIGEIAKPNYRGRFILLFFLYTILGITLSFGVQFFADSASANDIVSITLVVIAAIFSGCLYLIPKSPVWMYLNGYPKSARKIIKQLGDEDYQEAWSTSLKELKKKPTESVFTLSQFFERGNRKKYTITLVLILLLSVIGFQFFIPETALTHQIYMEELGAELDTGFLASLIALGFALISVLAVDRLGRKKVIASGVVLASIGMILAGISYQGAKYQWNDETAMEIVKYVEFEAKPGYSTALGDGRGIEFQRESDVVGHFMDRLPATDHAGFSRNKPFIISQIIQFNHSLAFVGQLVVVAGFALGIGGMIFLLISEWIPKRAEMWHISASGLLIVLVATGVYYSVLGLEGLFNPSTWLFLSAGISIICLMIILILSKESTSLTLAQIDKLYQES